MLCFECFLEVSKTVGNSFLGIDIPGRTGDQFIIKSIDTSTPEQFCWVGKGFRDFDGVVCGHIHHPEIREINGVTYCNDGDWVESLSALVETMDGELKLVYWHANAPVVVPAQIVDGKSSPAALPVSPPVSLPVSRPKPRVVPAAAPQPAIARSSVLLK